MPKFAVICNDDTVRSEQEEGINAFCSNCNALTLHKDVGNTELCIVCGAIHGTKRFSRVRATSQTFDRQDLAEKYAATVAKSRNPKVILAGSEYTERAEDVLARYGLQFRAVLVGDDCPTFCEDAAKDKDMDKVNVFPRRSHIHGKHYRCTISGEKRGHVSFDFWNSYADEEFNFAKSSGHVYPGGEPFFGSHKRYTWQELKNTRRTVTPYDLLACIQKYDPGIFEDFCDEYGYDSDSRKAESVYHAVVAEYRKVARFFTAEEMAEIQEIN